MPVLAGESRQIATEKFILGMKPVLYAPLWKRDGLIIPSDDGYGHQMTVTGATWGSQGRTYASGNYITVPNHANLDFTSSAFSMFIWINPTSVASTQALVFHGLTDTDGWFALLNSAGGVARLFVRTNQAAANQVTQSVDNTIFANTWQQVGFTRSGANIRTYNNGVDNTTSPSTHIDPVATSRVLKIGIHDDLSSNPFVGKIGEVSSDNRAPSPTEVMRNYQAMKWRYV